MEMSGQRRPGDVDRHVDRLAVLVIAGGYGRRLGGTKPGDKASIDVGGRPLLAHTVASLPIGAQVIVAGPQIDGVDGVAQWVQERPPGSGPLAAIASAAAVSGATGDFIGIVGGDMPQAGAALGLLYSAPWPHSTDVTVLVDTAGRRNPLAALWRAGSLRDALARLDSVIDGPAAALFEGARVDELVDVDGFAAGVDAPDDLRAFRSQE